MRVPANELEELYEVHTFGMFQGHQVPLQFLKQGVYHSRTGNRDLALGLEYRGLDPGNYERLFQPDELERIWEEKSPAALI